MEALIPFIWWKILVQLIGRKTQGGASFFIQWAKHRQLEWRLQNMDVSQNSDQRPILLGPVLPKETVHEQA